MSCYAPLRGFEGPVVKQGKKNVVWCRADSVRGVELFLPCGRCVGCRLERSRQWAMRCVHEASLYDRNCFITLTYDDDHLPSNWSLDVSEFQNFMKRLRKRFSCDCKVGRSKSCAEHAIRFYHCGEYGEKFGRPHFHALLFNFDFSDKVLYAVRNENKVYTSDILSSLWGNGQCLIGSVTYDSAAYVARYVMKKVTGDSADVHYRGRMPEYTTMSRRPGIGRGWYDKFAGDVFPSDQVIVNGKAVKPPRFYDNLLEVQNDSVFDSVKLKRVSEAAKRNVGKLLPSGGVGYESDDVRLRVKEQVKLASISSLRRVLE